MFDWCEYCRSLVCKKYAQMWNGLSNDLLRLDQSSDNDEHTDTSPFRVRCDNIDHKKITIWLGLTIQFLLQTSWV